MVRDTTVLIVSDEKHRLIKNVSVLAQSIVNTTDQALSCLEVHFSTHARMLAV